MVFIIGNYRRSGFVHALATISGKLDTVDFLYLSSFSPFEVVVLKKQFDTSQAVSGSTWLTELPCAQPLFENFDLGRG